MTISVQNTQKKNQSGNRKEEGKKHKEMRRQTKDL